MKEGDVVRVRGSLRRIGIIISVESGFNRYVVLWNDGTLAKNVGGRWIDVL